MPLQASDAVRNAMLLAAETHLGASPILEIRSGTIPANVAAAVTGTVLATLVLPADAFATPSSGSMGLLGTWQDTSADATGTATWYTLNTSGGTRVFQGTITATGGGGDLQLVTTSITATQPVQITAFSISVGGA